jgi:hypothetical protein
MTAVEIVRDAEGMELLVLQTWDLSDFILETLKLGRLGGPTWTPTTGA